MDISTPSGRPNLATCLKCSYPQILTFRSAIMHQFSSVVGYLDLDGCIPFDLILQDCIFKLGCFSCNKEMKAKVWIFIHFQCHSQYLNKHSSASVSWVQLALLTSTNNQHSILFIELFRVWPLDSLHTHGAPVVTAKWPYLLSLLGSLSLCLQSLRQVSRVHKLSYFFLGKKY